MREIKLNERLAAVAAFITKGVRVADIGTDHGYLPIWLVGNGICKNPIATDLREGPLGQAKAFATEYGVYDEISFRLGDGLGSISPGEIDTLVIAGMGGETIIHILSDAAWTKSEGCKLILQPQSKVPEVISWLNIEGYYLSGAKLAEDAGRIYLVMEALRGAATELTPVGHYVPDILLENRDPLLEKYIDGIINKLENALGGIKKASAGVDSKKTEFMIKALEGLYRIRGEINEGQC